MNKAFYKVEKIPILKNPKGNLYKVVSKNHKFFNIFGELYFTEVYPKKFKGWKYHEKRTQIITVLKGKVRFYLKKKINDKPKVINIEFPDKLKLLKIEPKTHYSFECISRSKSMIINLINEVVK